MNSFVVQSILEQARAAVRRTLTSLRRSLRSVFEGNYSRSSERYVSFSLLESSNESFKSIIKASPRQTRSLVDSHNWNEVSTLSRVCLIAGYQTKQPQHNQLYIPEVVHSVMMIAGLGATIVRKSVYGILINLLQSLFLGRTDDTLPTPELTRIMAEVTEDSTLELFGLRRATTSSEYTRFDAQPESVLLEQHERLARLLMRTMEAAAANKGEHILACLYLYQHTFKDF